ncbi:hypothetical protein AcetOrient_orf04542 [Acetobacter orientalis]|uniref:Uncharacterized protein n=1 Tax=Acetobacter orientalis TaxID=146474 RepID=A0A2Z5ZLQ4_9PROT|nr:hypothetical protein AcetOrient_orf04542 [Acetobacter orientalis]
MLYDSFMTPTLQYLCYPKQNRPNVAQQRLTLAIHHWACLPP